MGEHKAAESAVMTHDEKPIARNDDGLPPDVAALMQEFTGAKYNKLMRKLDLHLIPIIALLYLLAYLDRGNIGNARLAGLEKDLNMKGEQYNIALTIFFVSYIVFEVPANMALKYLSPRTWIPSITVSWGIVMTLMGIVHNYEGLLAARFFLGVPESGIFPAAAYYITMWYTRHEAMYRTALFYATASLAGAFSGLLAYAITLMDGIGGLAGWQWIFILEGLLTVLAGVLAYFAIFNGPDSVAWLTEEEKQYLKVKLAYDGNRWGKGTQEEGSKRKYIKEAFLDWQIYLSVVIYLGISVSTYGLVFGLPTIISTLGYSARIAQLMTVPPYVAACILTIAVAHFSDKLKKRGYFIAGSLVVSVIGFIMAITTSNNPGLAGVTYAGCFLACCGFFPAFPGVISWLANNLAGPYKRAIGMSLQISLGNTGGLIGSNIYLAREKPHYRLGYGISIGFIACAIIATAVMWFTLTTINRKRERYVEDNGGVEGIVEKHGDVTLTEMGDRSPLFHYTL
ncbi:major facilitator superfamily transporter [Purpureocillium lilacinum]|uniref:Major facilitator superfamily transporter n=1 Tax=Purpureocillium lilacinum TaxID=33203 RepID=A0A179HJU4_PURLI|nr:major facilitator superfamily transporter [Purpureocillium lilacinum]OAQ89908.1 major facilitator superfamily transporter [Purpureocillium lilacinum]